MDKQKLVVVLLVVAIVLSALNLIVNLGFDASDLTPATGQTTIIKGASADAGLVGFTNSQSGGESS
jgi:hypothetical protein